MGFNSGFKGLTQIREFSIWNIFWYSECWKGCGGYAVW